MDWYDVVLPSAVVSTIISFLMWYILGYLNWRRDIRRDNAKRRLETVLLPLRNFTRDLVEYIRFDGRISFPSDSEFENDYLILKDEIEGLQKKLSESEEFENMKTNHPILCQSLEKFFEDLHHWEMEKTFLSVEIFEVMKEPFDDLMERTARDPIFQKSFNIKKQDAWGSLSHELFGSIVVGLSVEDTVESMIRIIDPVMGCRWYPEDTEREYLSNFVKRIHEEVEGMEKIVIYREKKTKALSSGRILLSILTSQIDEDERLVHPS